MVMFNILLSIGIHTFLITTEKCVRITGDGWYRFQRKVSKFCSYHLWRPLFAYISAQHNHVRSYGIRISYNTIWKIWLWNSIQLCSRIRARVYGSDIQAPQCIVLRRILSIVHKNTLWKMRKFSHNHKVAYIEENCLSSHF